MTFQEDYGRKQGIFRTFRGRASGFGGMTGLRSSLYHKMESPIVRVALWAIGLGIVLTAVLEVLYIIVTNGTTFYPVVDFLLSISVILTVAVFFMAQGTRAEEDLRSSEEKFRDLFDNANDIIQTVNPDGKFTYVNRKWHDILGYSEDDLKELNLWDVIEDDCIEGCRKVLGDISRGKDVGHVEAVFISKGGGKRFLEGSVNGRFRDGEFISTRGIFRDVTLRKEMERILESERSQLLSIMDAVSEPTYVSDPETHEILYVNNCLRELLGRDVTGGLCYREFHNLDKPCDFCTNDIILKDKDNSYYWEHYNTFLNRHYSNCDRIIKWSDGRDVRFELAMDITDRKRMENELRESQERYRLITENTDDLIAVCDLSGYYTYVSPSHGAMGYDAGELLGSFCWDHVHPDDASELMGRVERLIGGEMEEKRSSLNLRFFDKAGREHELESSMTLIKDSDERPGHIILISRDMTERRRMEREIRHTKDKYLALVENSPEGIIVIQDAKLAFVNKASESLLGFQPDELVGKSFTDLVRPEDMETVVERYRKRMAGEEVAEVYEIHLLRKDGQYMPTEVFASVIDYDEKPADLVFLRDMTVRKKMELAMTRIMKQLEEKNQELEDYTYTVSHDLKAPLVTIQGFSELLTSQYGGELDEKAMHYLDRINQGSENLARLVTDLLELSRAGRKTREFQEHDFNDIVQISAEGLEGRLSQRGVKLEYPDDFPEVRGDDVRLTQVMSNLIGNAANYMGDQKDPEIKIGWERDGDNYVIWVEDNGIGIREQDRERIFKTFERASDGDNGGTGIGLSIVKKVIQTHGGEIRVESEPGRGSRFIFTLPVKGVE